LPLLFLLGKKDRIHLFSIQKIKRKVQH